MKLLLDTHTFLWLVWGHTNLSQTARTLLAVTQNDLYLSVASVWEIAIKVNLKKLILNVPLEVFINTRTTTYQLIVLPVHLPHAVAVVSLPNHHRDPFDRILIAQATVEHVAILSADAAFDAYPVQWLW
jgi:PIN domain nuclease of toxin-antitoxin system